MNSAVPEARAVRRPWTGLPVAFRAAVERELGWTVCADVPESGGFSQGCVARLRGPRGAKAFLKAVSIASDDFALDLYRWEALVAKELPANLPAPQFLAAVEEAEWTGLLFEELPGTTVSLPWRSSDLTTVIEAIVRLGEAATPCPVPQAPVWGERAATRLGWTSVTDEVMGTLPAWARRHYSEIVALEQRLPSAAAGETLVHSDLRSDNILICGDDVFFVDWAWAARGEAWIDPLVFALCAAVQGVTDPEEIFQRTPAGQRAHPDAVASVLAGLAGGFVYSANRPSASKPPGLAEFQRVEARVTLAWLARRLGYQ